MQEEFYLGDLVIKRDSMYPISLYFLGSEKLDNDRWRVNFAFSQTSGYAGQGSNMYLIAKLGESFRFGEGYKAAEEGKGLLGGEKKVFKKIKEVRFDDIEKDRIVLSYDFE